MLPGITIDGLLALVSLHGIPLAGFRIGRLPRLHPHSLSLPGPFNGCPEEAPGAVRDCRFHRSARHLSDEHSRTEPMVRPDGGPLETVLLDILCIAKDAGRRS